MYSNPTIHNRPASGNSLIYKPLFHIHYTMVNYIPSRTYFPRKTIKDLMRKETDMHISTSVVEEIDKVIVAIVIDLTRKAEKVANFRRVGKKLILSDIKDVSAYDALLKEVGQDPRDRAREEIDGK